MSGKTKTPVLSFPDSAPWEKKPFAKIADRKTTMGNDSELPRVEYEDVIPFRGALNKDVFLKASGKTGVRFLKDDVLFGKLRPYLGNWFFAEFNGLAVGDWWVLKARESVPEFLYALIQSPSFQDLANQSSGSKMPRADWGLVSEATFDISSSPTEQQSIGRFFRELDALIAEREKALGKLESLKKAMLEKMFPQGDAKVPEVRFKGFEGEWEEKKLSKFADFNPKGILPDCFEYVDLESVVGTEMKSHRTEMKRTAPSRAQRVAVIGDVFYQTVRPYQKNNCLFSLKTTKTFVFSTGYAQLRPHGDGYFLLSLLQNDDFVNRVLGECTGTSYPAISDSRLAELSVMVPRDRAEQQAIGSFFRSLDALLAARREEAEKLKQLKKAFLERMFA